MALSNLKDSGGLSWTTTPASRPTAVLLQVGADGREHALAYGIKTLPKRKRN